MTDQEIKQSILDIIGKIDPDADLSDINPDVRLREQIDLDSMDFLDIVMELRKQYGVEVPEAEYKELATLTSSTTYLRPKLSSVAYKKV
jgi:acyl carrier protein